jgi:ribosomal protein L7/L12
MLGLFGSADQDARLRAIERKLDMIIAALEIPEPTRSALDTQLLELARTGRKIEAIKVYREQTGASLADAKDHVDALR